MFTVKIGKSTLRDAFRDSLSFPTVLYIRVAESAPATRLSHRAGIPVAASEVNAPIPATQLRGAVEQCLILHGSMPVPDAFGAAHGRLSIVGQS